MFLPKKPESFQTRMNIVSVSGSYIYVLVNMALENDFVHPGLQKVRDGMFCMFNTLFDNFYAAEKI